MYSQRLLGVLGGMGPLASVAFLDNVYRLNSTGIERESPACILLSDTSFPDRSEAIFLDRGDAVVSRLCEALEALRGAGACKIIIACVTLHYFLPQVPANLRTLVVSLVDLALSRVANCAGRFLLLASGGARAGLIFESHPIWSAVEGRLMFPNEADQAHLRHWLTRLKSGDPGVDCIEWLKELVVRYQADGLLFGCTELHLLQQVLSKESVGWDDRISIIDPLWIAAEDIGSFLWL